MTGPPPSKHLVYIADPMCSWCHGFAPVIGAIAGRVAGQIPIHVVMGGLRPGETRPSREKDMAYLRAAWDQVAAASGRVFNPAFFAREGFVYDTEPACRAVVTIRHVYPADALRFLQALGEAFYAENRDMTNAGDIADVAQEAGFNRAEFLAAFGSPAARDETQHDFARCQETGVRGFPTLLAGSSGEGYRILTQGFCKLDEIEGALEQWIAT
jgi:putative protein-disulfide isomerase